MDKYEFISNLLVRDHLQSDQRDKIIKLTLKEIENDRLMGLDIQDRVKRLEEQIRSPKTPEQENEGPPDINPDYITPSDLYTYLKMFNSDPILSTTSHEIDVSTYNILLSEMDSVEYSFSHHMKLIKTRFWILQNEFPNINKNIKARIQSYLFDDPDARESNGWSDDHIKVTWNCKQLKDWAEANPRVPPNPDKDLVKRLNCSGFDDFPPIKAGNSKIRNMGDLALHFKNTIRINFVNTMFKVLNGVNTINKHWNDRIYIEINEGELSPNTELFTDVDKLKQCYREIINMAYNVPLLEGHDRHHIKVVFEDMGNQWVLSIHHLNSVFTKRPHNLVNRVGRDHRNLRNKTIGMCDLYLRADFGNSTFATINLLDDKSMHVQPISEFKGVEHILVFKL